MRTALLGPAAVVAAAAVIVSGGSGADSVRHRYFPVDNRLVTVDRFGTAREVSKRSLGDLGAIGSNPRWLARARPLGPGAPRWARRMYARSLLVLRSLTERNGAVIAGAREGWAYVWPRDAGTAAMAFAAAGYHGEARRVARFLLGLDLGAAARFHSDGTPVAGRAAQGDATGWVAAAARAAGLGARIPALPWRNHADYQEGTAGNYLGNALAWAAAEPKGHSAGDLSARRLRTEAIRRDFETSGELVREAGDPASGTDSAAAWAVRPFAQPALFPAARRTLLRLAGSSSRFGLLPSEDWHGGGDPWTAPTAWSAWSLAALARRDRQRGAAAAARRERQAALHLMAELHGDVTMAGFLPERLDAHTGVPASTTPLTWSHAFAILALRRLWPELHQLLPPADSKVDAVRGKRLDRQAGTRQRPSQ